MKTWITVNDKVKGNWVTHSWGGCRYSITTGLSDPNEPHTHAHNRHGHDNNNSSTMTVFPFKNMKSVLPLVTKSRVTIGNIITDKISFSFIKSVKKNLKK